jgi:hypothetical protein
MHLPSNPLQPLIGCPEAASCHEACGKQVDIDQTDSEAIQMMALNEEKDFVVVSFLNIWKRMKEGYDFFEESTKITVVVSAEGPAEPAVLFRQALQGVAHSGGQ